MIIDDSNLDDVITILEHVQATCALNNDFCQSCPFADHDNYNDCTLAHVPYLWALDKIGGDPDED